jgi:uncharacterized phage protein (TIGR02220 family)
MREYGKISPQFWIGKSGKTLRGNFEAQIVALYLMTSPHSEMTGVFHCPILYIAHETGLPFEGASKGLQSLIEADFCTYEAETETVFVHEMARYQIGDELKPSDNRVIGVQKIYASIPEGLIRRGFYEKYKNIFYLENSAQKASPSKAPSKGLGSQEQEQEQEDDMSGTPSLLEVLTHLNAKTNSEYQPVDSNLRLIAARLKEGATVDQCKDVIDRKVLDWATDEKMAQYLRPKTLFNATNFAQYVGELKKPKLAASGGAVDRRFAGAK